MAVEGAREVNARVVYWGVEGCGKTANLQAVYQKLRPDHRSQIREMPTRTDPTVSYEVLPIELGEISGVRTRLEITTAPGGPEQAPTRKQLLDQVDGVVLVIDSEPGRSDENLACYEELRQAVAAYGRRLDSMPLVVQYNKRDLGDPYAIESLHRKLEVGQAPVFEAVATEGTGVLQTLSTISKRVIRSLRDQPPGAAAGDAPEPEPAPAAARPAPLEAEEEPPDREPLVAEAPELELDAGELDAELEIESGELDAEPPPLEPETPVSPMEQAILDEASRPEAARTADQVEALLEAPDWEPEGAGQELNGELSIVSVGRAEQDGKRRVRVPLVLGDAAGHTTGVAITIELEPLIEETS